MASGFDDDRYDPERDDAREFGEERVNLAEVRSRVKGPATTMLVFAILSLVLAPISAINFFTLPAQMEEQRKQIDNNPGMPADQKKQMKEFFTMYERIILQVLPFSIGLQVIVGIISIIGSLKMLNMKSWGWGMGTAVLNIISIGHGCCCLTLPIGIWAVVVLLKPEVKAGFAEAARRGQGRDYRSDADDERDRY